MKTFVVTEQYISTITYTVEAESAQEAQALVREGDIEGAFDTDFDSGEITNIEEISDQYAEEA